MRTSTLSTSVQSRRRYSVTECTPYCKTSDAIFKARSQYVPPHKCLVWLAKRACLLVVLTFAFQQDMNGLTTQRIQHCMMWHDYPSFSAPDVPVEGITDVSDYCSSWKTDTYIAQTTRGLKETWLKTIFLLCIPVIAHGLITASWKTLGKMCLFYGVQRA